jgi:putative hydrolase of the HAD superfamily
VSIHAITFDVGGTLIEPWPSVGHVYAGVAARFGVKGLEPGWLTQNFLRAWKNRAGFDYERESWYSLVRETFGEHTVKLPAEFFPALFDRFAEADSWRVYDDVLPALQALGARGMKLGIISNWDDRLRPLLARLDLDRHFASLVISCEAGATKPDRRLFERAAVELDVAPEQLMHVGDSHSADVLGAGSIGAAGRQILRHGKVRHPWQIASLLELEADCHG